MLQRSLRFSVGGLALPLALSFLFFNGCGGSSFPSGPTGSVSGKVTYNGQPVPAGCSVMFMHVETSQSATSQTEADGTYSLRMLGGTKVLAGPYKISIAPPAVATPDDSDPEAYASVMEGGDTTPPPAAAPPFPDKYMNPDTSGLTYTVEEGPNVHDIDLSD